MLLSVHMTADTSFYRCGVRGVSGEGEGGGSAENTKLDLLVWSEGGEKGGREGGEEECSSPSV